MCMIILYSLLTCWRLIPQKHRSRQLGDLEAALEGMRLGQQQDLVGAEGQAGWVRIQVRKQRGLGEHQVHLHRRWVSIHGGCVSIQVDMCDLRAIRRILGTAVEARLMCKISLACPAG